MEAGGKETRILGDPVALWWVTMALMSGMRILGKKGGKRYLGLTSTGHSQTQT